MPRFAIFSVPPLIVKPFVLVTIQQITLSDTCHRIQINVEIRSGRERQRTHAERAKSNAGSDMAAVIDCDAAGNGSDAA